MLRGRVRYQRYATSPGSAWWIVLLQGLLFMVLAAAIVWNPALLVGFAAALLFTVGALAVVVALRLRQIRRAAYAAWSEQWWAHLVP